MSVAAARESAPLLFRDATGADHPALLELEGSAPHAGAALIQARTDFFARARAYPLWRVLVAEQAGVVAGVICMAANAVRVGDETCQAAYLFNLRVAPRLQRRGIGPMFMEEAWRWAAEAGASYCTGLIRTTNRPSLKMVAALGYRFPALFEYLIIPLSRFGPSPGVRIREVDLSARPLLAAWRMQKVAGHDFVPAFFEKELFAETPQGSYAGSLVATCAGGMAWLSLWDDRPGRGLDPGTFRAVKGFDLTLQGARGAEALGALFWALGEEGIDTLLLPLAEDDPARPVLAPLAGEVLAFQFVVKPLDGGGPPVTRPIYFDVRH